MHHKQRQHFTITLVVSFFVHLCVLTLLFTIPDSDNNDEYKKVRVRLGIKHRQKPDNFAMAQKYASFSPSAGNPKQSPVQENNVKNTNQVVENNIETKVQKATAQVARLEKNIVLADAAEVKNNNTENKLQASKPAKAALPDNIVGAVAAAKTPEKPLTKMPETKATAGNVQKDDYEDYGAVIGNSYEPSSGKLESYEQMLPLWLDKFKQHPTNPKGFRIEGEGEVFIKIDRKGKVLLSKVIKSTGSDALDKALTKMIADADPVLPVPDDYHTDKKTFSYKIAFEFKEPRNEQ